MNEETLRQKFASSRARPETPDDTLVRLDRDILVARMQLDALLAERQHLAQSLMVEQPE